LLELEKDRGPVAVRDAGIDRGRTDAPVPEVILARHCGLAVAALSVITNLAEGLGAEPLSHAETLAVAARAADDLARLIAGFCAELCQEDIHRGDAKDTGKGM